MLVLVTGAGGQLGQEVVRFLQGEEPAGGTSKDWWGCARSSASRDLEVVGASHDRLAVEERLSVLDAVESLRPDVIIHAGAFTAVDACESHPDRAFAVNALGTRHVAEAAGRYGAHLLYISTDYVFDGTSDRPYHEWDIPRPLSVYGASKLGGELECPPGSTIVRTSWVCGVFGKNMLHTVLGLAGRGLPLRFVDDQKGCPTFTADLAKAVATLALDRRSGTYHVTNQGETTWFGFAQAVLEATGYDASAIEAITTAQLDPPRPAPRPSNSALDNLALRLGGLPLLPDWRDALGRAIVALDIQGQGGARS